MTKKYNAQLEENKENQYTALYNENDMLTHMSVS